MPGEEIGIRIDQTLTQDATGTSFTWDPVSLADGYAIFIDSGSSPVTTVTTPACKVSAGAGNREQDAAVRYGGKLGADGAYRVYAKYFDRDNTETANGSPKSDGWHKNLAGFRVVRDRPVGDKETRSYPFACQLNDGNVSVVQGPWTAPYIEELRFFPFSTRKDQVDASSGAFAILLKARVLGAI